MGKVVPDIGSSVQNVMKLYMLSKFFRSLLYSESLMNVNSQTIEMGLLPWVDLIETEPEQELVQQDSHADSFYFLYQGVVSAALVRSDADGEGDSEPLVSALGPGTYFGEMGILTNTPCRATLKCLTKCMMLKVSKTNFLRRFCSVPGFRSEFLIRILGNSCQLSQVLEHDIARRVFEMHLASEHASENIHFYDRSIKYRRNYDSKTDAGNLAEAQTLYRTYVASDAPEQVNIPNRMSTQIKDIVTVSPEESSRYAKEPDFRYPPRDLFSDATVETKKLLEKDNFRRFKNSPQFAALLRDLKACDGIDLSNIAEELKGATE